MRLKHSSTPPSIVIGNKNTLSTTPRMQFTRAEQVTIFRLRTGHNRLKHHLFSRFRIGDGPNCPCGANRQDANHQDAQHVLQDCPLLDDARLKYWPEPREMNQKLWQRSPAENHCGVHLCLRPHHLIYHGERRRRRFDSPYKKFET
ncbi:hypothetical protein ElyMa_002801600 [Elysia marginata]|uniref:Reverse transcriptase zinc-binding domain-containing protein n=1 Tax=Elysia marginata TaxID=1093978 RepID=A0AAV4HTI1_9GAST|nr:hypothetical protein ElyMa_002801600 [Elysia marginata]